MFEVNVSPFLLSVMIKHHIEKYREQHPEATEMLDTCLYVDDVISGAGDISQALKISKDADAIMKNASIKLPKWNSNDQTLMKTWAYEDRDTSSSLGKQFSSPIIKNFRDTMECHPRLFHNLSERTAKIGYIKTCHKKNFAAISW
ncbi:reverse transcriptase domain-containing protein [Nephila pilipes]|uniref:Reverse transcriptase domain-containing protein n=1 Tax=Nephila pilipes TaxID=299642 RepID=A0A8X6PMM4_NEPPI|nr:reverse transcriptase domain-containing protein [Nephila pilipes]